ncbi:MAG: protoporphyrinogen oxidase [Nitrospirota bacterium]|nr:protoporphyrinogen oxidase [Nitrospirota bacterium]
MSGAPRHVAIVGGGIAGLSTAFALQAQAAEAEFPLSITVIEAGSSWGGKIATHRVGELVIERGPDSFLSQKPAGLELCAKLGLSDRLVNTNPSGQGAFVYSRGKLRRLPEGLVLFVPSKLGPFLRSGLLSLPGIMRMGADLVLPRQHVKGDESLADFFRRRFGAEAFDRLIEPLMAGIYAGDAEQMSLRATFPRFIELERKHGSLIRGMLAGRRNAASSGQAPQAGPSPRTMFVTMKNGMDELVQALVGRVERAGAALQPGRRVHSLRAPSVRSKVWTYDLVLEDGGVVTADVVVLAVPAYVAAPLIRPHSRPAAEKLEAIPYATTATVSLAYAATDLGPQVRGFGFVVPRAERRDLIAATWTSLKWPHRAPPSQTLIRCYLGGVGREQSLALDDDALLRRVKEELRAMVGVTAEPAYADVSRWERGMPQYTIGHPSRLEALQVALNPYKGLYLTGAAYRGVGIPDCIKDGSDTAAHIVRYLAERRA